MMLNKVFRLLKEGNKSPVKRNILANLFGVFVNLLNQIILVPFYIIYWGNNLYSDWIVISAFTVFFTMTDIGLNSVIQNRFAIKYSEGNLKECNSLLMANFFVVAIVCAVVILIAIGYISFFDITKNLELSIMSKKEASLIFFILLINVFIQMVSGIENAIFRAIHKASVAVYYDQFTKLFIVCITLICLFFHIPIIIMCVLICTPNLFLVGFKHIKARSYFKYSFSFKYLDFKLLKSVLFPAVAYLSFPVSNAIVLQGFTLLVNRFWGADTVVLYNTTRTMCNFIKTFLGTISNSIWPEFSIAYGRKDCNLMKHYYKKAIKLSFLLALIICIGLLLFGPYIYDFWTHGKVIFSYKLMISFLTVLLANTLWNTGYVALLATNNHITLGFLNVFLAITSLFVAYIMSTFSCSIDYITYSLLIMDVTLTIFVNKRFEKMLSRISIGY